MDKPFRTIDQQVAILGLRGVEIGPETAAVLRREGYYSVVNGYKQPFIDQGRTASEGDDRYKAGTKFSEIYDLFLFDRSLRELTFRYLIRTEALVRTACAYCFCDAHRDPDDYLRPNSYASEVEYMRFGLKDYADNLTKLTSKLRNRARSSGTDFIRFYRDRHGKVPLWVLANDLTFGNMQHFFNLMKPKEQAAVCRHIAMATGRAGGRELGYFDPSEARTSIDYLVKYRNSCAHDDRLYCTKVGTHRECDYATMLRRIQRFLPENEYKEMLSGVTGLMQSSAASSPVMRHLITNMGFSMSERENEIFISFKERRKTDK